MQALWAVANLAVHDEFKLQIGEAGAMPILVSNLQDGQDRVARRPIGRRMAHQSPNEPGVSARPTAAPNGTQDEPTLLQAARAVANLVVASENRTRLATEGISIRCIHRSRDTSICTPELSLLLTGNRRRDAWYQRACSHAPPVMHPPSGGIKALLKVADAPYPPVQEAVARAVVNMSFEREFALETIQVELPSPWDTRHLPLRAALAPPLPPQTTISPPSSHGGLLMEADLSQAGGVPPIARLLSSASTRVQQEASWAVVNFSVCADVVGRCGHMSSSSSRGSWKGTLSRITRARVGVCVITDVVVCTGSLADLLLSACGVCAAGGRRIERRITRAPRAAAQLSAGAIERAILTQSARATLAPGGARLMHAMHLPMAPTCDRSRVWQV